MKEATEERRENLSPMQNDLNLSLFVSVRNTNKRHLQKNKQNKKQSLSTGHPSLPKYLNSNTYTHSFLIYSVYPLKQGKDKYWTSNLIFRKKCMCVRCFYLTGHTKSAFSHTWPCVSHTETTYRVYSTCLKVHTHRFALLSL